MSDSRPRNGMLWIATCLMSLYFVPFLLIYIDEIVVGSNIAQGFLPDVAEDVFRLIYAPLIKWCCN